MRRRWLWVGSAAVILFLAAGVYAVIRVKTAVVENFRANYGTMVLGISPGEVVPAAGQRIGAIPSSDPQLDLVVPVDLYPGARVVGFSVTTAYEPYTDGPLPTATILMTSGDPEQQILDYYLAAWKEHDARETREQESLVYSSIDPEIRERTVIIAAEDSVMAFVETARGPALGVADNLTYAKWLTGDAELQPEPGAETVTAIWLYVPLWGVSP